MRYLFHDFRLAVRGVTRRPTYSLAVIATLAIGIGANTAIYSVFNWVLFRPLPGVERPDDLATIKYQTATRSGSYFLSYRDYADLRDHATQSVTGIAAAAPQRMDLLVGNETVRVQSELVTTNYFALMGVRPIRGRDFQADEERPGGPASIIISERLWRRAFGSDSSLVSRAVRVNGRPFTVVGIAPADFGGRSAVDPAEFWMTISGHVTLLPAKSKIETVLTSRRYTLFGDAFARLRPGFTLAQAQAEADAVVAGLPEFGTAFSKPGQRSDIGPVFYQGIGHETTTAEQLRRMFQLLIAAVGLLLVLACANASNLLLARSTARRREIAVCQAIGASRFRIVRQQLAEGLLLSSLAGVAGLALAFWLTRLFDGMRIVSSLAAIQQVQIDWRVCVFAAAASIVTGLVFATAPALVSTRIDLAGSMRGAPGASRGRRRLLRSSLVVVQIAVSVLLLFGAGLFMRTLQNIRRLDLGLHTEGIVSLTVQPSSFGLDIDRSSAYIRELLERLRAAPGITNAAFAWTHSFSPNRANMAFNRTDAGGEPLVANQTAVSPGFFETMKVPLIAGRDFTDQDAGLPDSAPTPVIISRTLADAAFPQGGALGSHLPLVLPEGKSVLVVGIAGDVRGRAITKTPEAWVYTPAKPVWGTIQVRSGLPNEQVIAAIRQIAHQIDPVVSPHTIEPFDAAVDRAIAEQRLFARVSVIFGAIGAALAGIGIYAMMAGAVAERRREFGIRLALGARGGAVVALVLRSVLGLTAFGLIAGIAGAYAARTTIESRLFGVTPMDSPTMVLTIVAVITVGILAALIPALRAARVDPVQSLRVEG